MNPSAPGSRDSSLSSANQATHARLTAIEGHMRYIETLLIGTSQFHNRLDQIHATLELAIGFLTPGGNTTNSTADSSSAKDQSDRPNAKLRVVAHLSRDGHGARLVPDAAWADMWSVRLFVMGLLQNAARSGLPSLGCRCWCEVWSPDESGELVDSAFLDPDSGAVEWQSDLLDGGDGS